MRTPLIRLAITSLFAVIVPTAASGQVAGSTTIGIEVDQLKVVAAGWSVKKQVIGKLVFNENGEKVGRIEDLIVAPDGNLSFAIIGAAWFVDTGKHDVAIPISQISIQDGKFVLPGASKAVVKAMPAFEYGK